MPPGVCHPRECGSVLRCAPKRFVFPARRLEGSAGGFAKPVLIHPARLMAKRAGISPKNYGSPG
mgnify:CR=1 FL=1